MEIVKASVEMLYPHDKEQARLDMKRLEAAGRTCYKSEANITDESAGKFAQMVIRRGHESVIEHVQASFRIICDRGVSHELVRHRMASFSQESTRYVNYNKRGMQFIDPSEEMPMNPNQKKAWLMAVTTAENMYNKLVETGAPPELARSVLPNSLKTELVMTANLREWRHFLKLRCDKAAHPQMRTIANMIRASLCEMYPDVFV